MMTFRLLFFCLLICCSTSYAQSVYTRVMTGFTTMAGGKNEWIDLDNDKDLDLLSTGADGSLPFTVVYENVAGTLTTRSTSLPSMSHFASADYDNDGDVDLLAFNTSSSFTMVYRNNGNFSFSQSATIGSFSPSSAVWLDIDNDEDLDILLVGNISVPRLFENTGTGFTEVTGTGFPSCSACTSDVADINGDGKTDVVFTGGVTYLYLNAGNKTFSLYTGSTFKQLTQGDVACGDFDGDGDFDILMTGLLNGDEYTGLYENEHNRFTERTNMALTPVVTTSSSGLLWFNINNDGKLDLFLSGSSDKSNPYAGTAKVFKNTGTGFADIFDGYLGTDRFSGSYDAGDYDNDGDMDLAFQGTYSALEGAFPSITVLHRIAGFYRHDGIRLTPAFRSNTKPQPPVVNTFNEKAFRNEIRLVWGEGTDVETPAGGLFYNFYLRDGAKKFIVPAVNLSNGNLLSSNSPNGTGRAGYAVNMPEGELYYAVQSIDGARQGSDFSSEKTFYHFNGPEAVKAEFTDQQHVTLSWIDHSSLETNFEVLRSTSPATNFATVATLPSDTDSYSDNFGFATETEYYYQVRGYNLQASLYDSLKFVIPERPSDLSATSPNATKVKLTWKDQSQYEIAYIVERRQGTDVFTTIAALGQNVTQYEDTQVLGGNTYEYRVMSKGNNGTLVPTVSASVTTNAKPIGVTFEKVQDEDKVLLFTADDFNHHFTDANSLDKLLRIKIVTLPGNGTLSVYNSNAVVGQEITIDLLNFIEFKPYDNYAGTVSFDILAYDGKDYSDNWTVKLKINQVNDAPQFDLVSAKILDEDFSGTTTIFWQPMFFTGEESQAITYSISPQSSGIVSVAMSATDRKLSFTSKKDIFGEVEFTVTANDGQPTNNTYSRTIKITIKSVDDPPVFAPIADIQGPSTPAFVSLDVKDVDTKIIASMFSGYSSNSTIVKASNITFADDNGKITMTISPENKLGTAFLQVLLNTDNSYQYQNFKFSVVVITGLESIPNDEIILFPNPTMDDLQVQGGQENNPLKIVIRTSLGSTVKELVITEATSHIDVRDLSPGMYYFELVRNGEIISSRKIVKQ